MRNTFQQRDDARQAHCVSSQATALAMPRSVAPSHTYFYPAICTTLRERIGHTN